MKPEITQRIETEEEHTELQFEPASSYGCAIATFVKLEENPVQFAMTEAVYVGILPNDRPPIESSQETSLKPEPEIKPSECSEDEGEPLQVIYDYSPPTKKRRFFGPHAINTTLIKKSVGLFPLPEGLEAYIPSPYDQHNLVVVQKLDLLKKQGGRALFAKQFIPEGTVVAGYTGEEYENSAFIKLVKEQNKDRSYAMTVGKITIDALRKGNYARYINYSDCQDNVVFLKQAVHNNKNVVIVQASKDIEAGEQLLVDYNVFSETISTEYFCINPQDCSLSTQQIWDANSNFYSIMPTSPLLRKNFWSRCNPSNILVTESLQLILNEEELAPHLKDNSTLNLLAIPLQNDHKPYSFDEADVVTPLMLASYLGQVQNVDFLLQNKSHINRQQNHSGNCALFFALQGYTASPIRKRPNYIKILQNLIAQGAVLRVHDRQDRTFLHKAAATLSPHDFGKIVISCARAAKGNYRSLFQYIDKDYFDPVLFCLANKKFEHVKHLLQHYPGYFKLLMRQLNAQLEPLRHATANYRACDWQKFKSCFESTDFFNKFKAILEDNECSLDCKR